MNVEQFSVNPLPASGNNPGDASTATINGKVTLDKESYENPKSEIPAELLGAGGLTAAGLAAIGGAALLERKSDTPIAEVSNTAAEVADTAAKLDASQASMHPISYSLSGPVGGSLVADNAGVDSEVGTPKQGIIRHDTLEEPPKSVDGVDPATQKVTELIDESTSHRKPGEEVITEPAPQPSEASLHGVTVPESEAPVSSTPDTPPTVVVSSPSAENPGDAAQDRTVEIVEPSPPEQGEIYSHSVWNQSVSPLLQLSLEQQPEGGVRRRKPQEGADDAKRPGTAGSDVVSAKHHRNFLATFWNVFIFSWLGGAGRFFTGLFGKRGPKPASRRNM